MKKLKFFIFKYYLLHYTIIMRKYTLSLLLCLAVIVSACAQGKNVRKAQSSLDKAELAEAKSYIDEAITHEKTKDKGKTWFTYGEVYHAIATDTTDTAPDVNDPYEKALEGYRKAKQLEKEGSTYYAFADQKIQEIWANSVNKGAEYYQEQDFGKAVELFDVAKKAIPEDTTAYIYAGISAQQAGNLDIAADNYEYLIDSLDYQSEDFYNSLIYIYTVEKKDTDKALEYLRKAQETFPENDDFLKTEINILINDENFEEASDKLSKAIEKEPDNPVLYYNRGFLYEQMGQGDKAVENYKQALELDPNYYDAAFNLGAYHYNQAAEVLKEANEMDLKEYEKRGKEIEEKAKTYFEKALPYLEKAREIKPEDEKVLSTLQTVYSRLGMEEKAEEIENKLSGE